MAKLRMGNKQKNYRRGPPVEPTSDRLKAHEQVGCHCGFDHGGEATCHWAKWENFSIERCHREAVEGSSFCLLHFITTVTN